MQIEEGGFYRTRVGLKVGPVRRFKDGVYEWTDGKHTWQNDGFFYNAHSKVGLDIIALWTDDQPAPEAVKLPAPEKQIRAGDVVHVRMRVTESFDDGSGAKCSFFGCNERHVIGSEEIVHVEPRPPEPLKVGDKVRDSCGGPDIGVILAIDGSDAWVKWGDEWRLVHDINELEPAHD